MPSPKSRPKPRPRVGSASRRVAFDAIGTRWEIDVNEPVSERTLLALEAAVKERVEKFDRDYSRFRDDSLITAMAKLAATYRLPADAQPLFDLYLELYELTDGLMTPLIGQLLSDAGYDAAYSLRPGELQTPPAWNEALQYSFPDLTVKTPSLIDLGAAGKGYLVDIIGSLLEAHGIRSYCVDAGGDMIYRGSAGRPLEVGLEHPDNAGQVIGVARLQNASLCGSAGNRRAWGEYHHIMNPRTMKPVDGTRAVWVVAASTLLADALTTALCFAEPRVLTERYAFEYAILRSDYSLEYSPNMPATFFTPET